MKANNTQGTTVHKFEVVKYNKHDTIYQLCLGQSTNQLITQSVKLEKFQGFSKAFNLDLYFRVKDKSSWKNSKKVTGLWKTTRLNHYFGDHRTDKGKTLLLFKVDRESQTMYVYQYANGYYPNRIVIDSLINQI